MSTIERWLPIEMCPLYEVSDMGRIRRAAVLVSKNRGGRIYGEVGKVRKPSIKTDGYHIVNLANHKSTYIHRIVLLAFVGPCPEGMEVAHLDGNRGNNALSNLAYVTRLENNQHKHVHGTMARGEKSGQAKLTESKVMKIRADQRGNKSIATDYGISPTTVYDIKIRKTWKHL